MKKGDSWEETRIFVLTKNGEFTKSRPYYEQERSTAMAVASQTKRRKRIESVTVRTTRVEVLAVIQI